LYERINDLLIGEKYKITLQTVDNKNRESTGIVKTITPQPSSAPRDPQGIAYDFNVGTSGVTVNLSWTDGDTPYDPSATFRYKIYVTVDGQQESVGIDVPLGLTEEQISLYSFDLFNYFTIPEN